MSRLTPLLLLALVASLGVFAYRQARLEAALPQEELEPLFKGVEPGRVRALRLENLERAIHARIERSEQGAWFLTDPIAYPAAPEFVEQVFEVLSRNLAGPVPEALADRARAGLEPPRAFLEVEELMDDGALRKTRVYLGVVDLDGQRCFVRREGGVDAGVLHEGRTLRTMRNLETLLERDLPDMRSRRLFRVDPLSVVELARRGRVYLDGNAPPVDWVAQAEGAGWRMYQPLRARVDADVMQVYTGALASLRAGRFVSDLPDADLSRYGLAPAWFSITLRDRRGGESTVEFGQDDAHQTFARHPGLPNVFEVSDRDWNMLTEGLLNLNDFMEREFARVLRDHIGDIVIERGERSTKLVRASDGQWSVAERPAGEGEFRAPVPAEPAAVDELLARVENDLKLTYLFDRQASDVFPRDASGGAPPREGALWITPLGDRRQGGWVGPEIRTSEGTALRAFLREDEGVVAGLDAAIMEVLDYDAAHFLRRIVWDVTEVQLRELTLTHDDRSRRYVRGDGFTWRPADADVPARELRQLLDAILFLKADGEVAPRDRRDLADTVRIELVDAEGQRLVADLGLNPDGVVELVHGVRRARALDQDLHAKLRALIDG